MIFNKAGILSAFILMLLGYIGTSEQVFCDYTSKYPQGHVISKQNDCNMFYGNNIYLDSKNISVDNIVEKLNLFMQENQSIFCIDMSQLKLGEIYNFNNRYYVSFTQVYKNVPVLNGCLKVVVLSDGRVLMIDDGICKDIITDTNPKFNVEAAKNIDKNSLDLPEEVKYDKDDLVIVRFDNEYKLCWELMAEERFNQRRIINYIDATTGNIVFSKSDIANYVSGDVNLVAWSGQWGTTPGPDISAASKFQQVKFINYNGQIGGTCNANQSGHYYCNPSFSVLAVAADVTGVHANINRTYGSRAYYQSQTTSWTWNNSSHYREYHLYYWMNENWLKFTGVTGFSTNYFYSNRMDGTTEYDVYGSYNAGSTGNDIKIGSNNEQGATVYHEYAHCILYKAAGHWLGDQQGNSEGSAMNEGLADYYSCSFRGSSIYPVYGGDRNLSNTINYNGGIDDRYVGGKIIGGACWDLRSLLGQSAVDDLVYETTTTMLSNQSFGTFMDKMLLADDTDGNIYNGTPHQNEIFTAFSTNHGILGNYVGGSIGCPTTIHLSGTVVVLNDLTIPSGKSISFDSGTTVYVADGKNIIVEGTLYAASNVSFSKVPGGTGWDGIQINSGGSMSVSGPITIENANFGIFLYGSTGFTNSSRITISNCSVSGIRVTDCSPSIHDITFTNCQTGMEIIGPTSAPTIYNTTVSSGTLYGLSSLTYAIPRLQNSIINESVSSHKIYVYTYGNLDIDQEYNNIYDTASNYAVYVASNCSNIAVRNNYWGTIQPYVAADLFNDPSKITDWSGYSTSPYAGAGKLAVQELAEIDGLFQESIANEMAGSYDDAIKNYEDILAKSINSTVRMKALRYMYAATEKSGSNYGKMRETINTELMSADARNKAVLQYLLANILVYEKKYEEAVDKFLEMSTTYKGSSMEVDALIKVAMIYGQYLDDKSNAEMYAEMAKALNQGHPTLFDAYAAAGICYEPWNYENKYAELQEDFTVYDAAQPESKDGETDEEFVFVSPNPANPITTITYFIKTASDVKLSVYSINGQKVAELVNGPVSAGVHSVTFDGSKYASGVYLYQFQSAGLRKTGKMMMLK